MKKRARTTIILTPESWLHTLIHFIGVVAIFWLVIFPPLWLSILAMVLEKLQMQILGHCFLTNFAHKRGVMVGMTYWEYVSRICGVKDYKQAGLTIDNGIKISIIGILLIRIVLWITSM